MTRMKASLVEQPKREKLSSPMKAARKNSFDSDEVQMYLTKLTHLVPNAPKHRPLSKLEVIQCVIDYICDLEDTLLTRQETRPSPTVLSEKQNTLYLQRCRRHPTTFVAIRELRRHMTSRTRQLLVTRRHSVTPATS